MEMALLKSMSMTRPFTRNLTIKYHEFMTNETCISTAQERGSATPSNLPPQYTAGAAILLSKPIQYGETRLSYNPQRTGDIATENRNAALPMLQKTEAM
jgi:hypothetical protein